MRSSVRSSRPSRPSTAGRTMSRRRSTAPLCRPGSSRASRAGTGWIRTRCWPFRRETRAFSPGTPTAASSSSCPSARPSSPAARFRSVTSSRPRRLEARPRSRSSSPAASAGPGAWPKESSPRSSSSGKAAGPRPRPVIARSGTRTRRTRPSRKDASTASAMLSCARTSRPRPSFSSSSTRRTIPGPGTSTTASARAMPRSAGRPRRSGATNGRSSSILRAPAAGPRSRSSKSSIIPVIEPDPKESPMTKSPALGVRAILTVLVIVLAAPFAAAQATKIDVPFQKFVLDNGLTLIVHEDHKAPIVAFNVWYHVGSKNEVAGKTGFAHLFEHLMFNGSENYNDDYFQALDRAGATDLNGTTNEDRTNYFQNVPVHALDMVLWMESDRMGHLVGAIDQAKLDEQRGAVQNEKRQGDNQPYSISEELITKAVWPASHPYSHTVIGSMEDLNAA